jgi:hypothetical protein
MKLILNENEKNEISSQHEEIDSRLFNFLLRRVQRNEKNLVGDFGNIDQLPLTIVEYTFDELPGYGFSSFMESKGQIEYYIINMLFENDIIDFYPYELDQRDPKRVKIIKTIRKFVNFILTD